MVLTYKLLNFREDEPKSYEPVEKGTRDEENLPVAVMVSEVASPNVTLPVILAVPATCNVEDGVIVPTPKLPEASMVIPEVAVPAVIKPILFVPIRYSPVSTSSVNVSPGAVAVPSANLTTPEITGELAKDKVIELPKVTSPPPLKLVPAVTVTLELVRAELGILVRVFEPPEMDLLVRVSVVSFPTRVVVASGRVMVLAAAGVQVRVPMGPPDWKTSWSLVAERFKVSKVGLAVVDIS